MIGHLKTTDALLAAVIAIIAGFISAKYLVQGNPLVVLPWGVLAFLSVLKAKSKREALMLGGIIGFVSAYSYLWFDNTDKLTPTKVLFLTFLIVLPSLFGLLCGLLCSWIGWLTRKHLLKLK